MIISNEQTKTALHVSERAYITNNTPIFDLTTKTLAFDITNSGHIPSGLIEIIAHESTSNATRATIPEIASAVEYHWKRHKVAALPPGKGLFSFLVPVHAFSEDKFKPDEGTYQLILVAGKISYYDGFPDDDRQEWLFCFQSVYHLDLKRIVFVYCDPERVIPQMENRDGYPRNEAADQAAPASPHSPSSNGAAGEVFQSARPTPRPQDLKLPARVSPFPPSRAFHIDFAGLSVMGVMRL